MSLQYDVMVIGGGPAGAAACLTLAKYTGLKVGLIDAGHPATDFRVGETTSTALLPTLRYLGALEAFEADAHMPCQRMLAAWGSSVMSERHGVFSSWGTGWLLDRGRFDGMLLDLAAGLGAELHLGHRLAGLQVEADGWAVSLRATGGTRTAKARFLIDASGRTGQVAGHLGVETSIQDRLAAYMAIFQSDRPLDGQLCIETVADGWWYSSVLPGQRLLVAMMTDVDIAKAQGYHQLESWVEHLCGTHHIYPQIEGLQLDQGLLVRPAHSKRLLQPIGPNWIAAGEANLSFDPISSMGIGYALTSGIHAARKCAELLRSQDALDDHYRLDAQRQFEEYLQLRARFYAAEQRWPEAAFWKRRHAIAL
jgi:flavin-dependent dehydrogenase